MGAARKSQRFEMAVWRLIFSFIRAVMAALYTADNLWQSMGTSSKADGLDFRLADDVLH
ncbi:MAG: hypothetical protein JWM59_4194 [Verrucomicrobiales bacterium]|nr:hypothetical protein [Verrucomicrobiales bacterium]